MNGILVINKPKDFTSFDVCAIIRRLAKTKKVGHGGTLDPMATGVLPVFIGSAAKAADLVPDKDKSYRAGFRLGVRSDTLDVWGELSEEKDVFIKKSDLEAVLDGFIGEIEQIPPMYSALKVNGQKLCDLARKGVEVERRARKINISRIELVDFDGKNGTIEVDCSGGTYIRSLCADVGEKLGTGAVMTGLVRTKSCGFGLSCAAELEDVRKCSAEELEKMLFRTEILFKSCGAAFLDDIQRKMYENGVRLDFDRIENKAGNIAENELLRIYAGGEFLGVGKVNSERELVSVKRFNG